MGRRGRGRGGTVEEGGGNWAGEYLTLCVLEVEWSAALRSGVHFLL